MKRILQKLLLILGYTIKVDNKQVLKLIYEFYHNIKEYDRVLLYVTKVEVTESKLKGMSILIESYHPGLLVGKGGSDINEFKEYLYDELNRKDVNINLKECMLWHKLYS